MVFEASARRTLRRFGLRVLKPLPTEPAESVEAFVGCIAWAALISETACAASKVPLDLLGKLANYQSVKAACKTAKRKTPADFRKGADVFKALSNANRLLIVDALSGGERCVADLTALVGLDISTVSNHLAVLRGVGLVVDERRGTQVFYSLRNPCVLNIFCCLDDFHASDAG